MSRSSADTLPGAVRIEQRLILIVPPNTSAASVTVALGKGDVAAIVIGPETADGDALVKAAQSSGAAVLIAQDACKHGSEAAWPAPFGADGLHLLSGVPADDEAASADPVATLKARPDGAMCGAVAATKHEAMLAGEASSDYVWFDGESDLGAACALAAWWQSLFEVPAVIAGRSDPAALAAMIETRAEFVAIMDAFSSEAGETAADRVQRTNEALRAGPGAL
ncbi:MAG: hypothetical protein AAGF49_00670 [Pseudomonadota bacterium]